jgi:predicted RNA methylase
LLRGIPPAFDGNYNHHWKYVSFKGKTILDLGADYGSTADYFLANGAKKVVAVEGNHDYARKLFQNFSSDKRVVCIQKWISSGKDINQLIKTFLPDIVKVDIEGEEKTLLNVDVAKVKEWLIETHTEELYNAIQKFFRQNGFNVSTVEYGKTMNKPFIKVLVTTSHEHSKRGVAENEGCNTSRRPRHTVKTVNAHRA